jgi:tetratricopeptide (TPR) repeat protein
MKRNIIIVLLLSSATAILFFGCNNNGTANSAAAPTATSAAKRSTENQEAFSAYIKGRFYWSKRTDAALKESVNYFQQAIAKDPNYALAYAGLADSYNIIGNYNMQPPNEVFPLAKTAARKALELDSSLAEAHASLAYILGSYDWNWQEAEKEYKRAIELKPDYATAHQWYALDLTSVGKMDEALAEIKRAQELDPASLIIAANVGWVYYFNRQADPAIERCQQTLQLEPKFTPAHLILAMAYQLKGKYPEAINEARLATEISGNNSLMLAELGHSYALAGQQDEARKVLAQLKEQSGQQFISPYDIARIYVALGDKDTAFEMLNKAVQERPTLFMLVKADPAFDPLRNDARFTALLKKINLA